MSTQEFNVKTHLIAFANYIKENHPEMIFNEGKEEVEKFCVEKVDQMNTHFSELLSQGETIDVAFEMATNQMYNGLVFSKYKFVKELMKKHQRPAYDNMLESGSLQLQIIEILNQSHKVFEKFDTNDLSLDLTALEEKLTPIISALIANKN